MLITRRTFLKATAITGGAAVITPNKIWGKFPSPTGEFFGLNSFIDRHPDAVFIMRTNVDQKTNSNAIKEAGLAFGKSVFVHRDESDGGIPITQKVVLKPNITCRYPGSTGYTKTGTMGIVTDSNFVEGIIESIKALGIVGKNFYIRETNCPSDFEEGSYYSMAARTGADLRDLSANVNDLAPENVQWVNIENGVYFNKLPYLAPVNSPGSYLINIAKLKAHSMGLTLCAKNIQGAIAHNYQVHCQPYNAEMDIPAEHIKKNAKEVIMANFLRHLDQKIPRWDKPGDYGGLWMELWATRCLDNNSVTHPGIHIIEGIYGRDGNFVSGPDPKGLATDYMTNLIIFGKNQFHVDNIGHYLGGHEPGNFGLFHLAIERGFSSLLNPRDIPLYEWKADGTATLTNLSTFPRAALKTRYLQRDYNGQNESEWHLVNEPFNYPTNVNKPNTSGRPEAFVLKQNYPNPFNPSTSIEYYIPKNGNVRLEVLDIYGRIVDILEDSYLPMGSHLTVWNNRHAPSGVYFYRILFDGYSKTKQMVLLK
ncbi:MAG: DUF362 domain-containing protein [Bacillota bacterium]